jgi:hypothetical protein
VELPKNGTANMLVCHSGNVPELLANSYAVIIAATVIRNVCGHLSTLLCAGNRIKLTVSLQISGIFDEGAQDCQQCSKANRECKRGSNFRFKRVHFVSQRSGGDTRKVLFAYEPNQVWVSTPQISKVILC